MFEEYQNRTGEIVSGVIKRVEYGNVTVDLGRGEGYMRRHTLSRVSALVGTLEIPRK